MNVELERMRKEVIMAFFRGPQHLTSGTEENHENLLDGQHSS
jgi:hypothetical protein